MLFSFLFIIFASIKISIHTVEKYKVYTVVCTVNFVDRFRRNHEIMKFDHKLPFSTYIR